MKRVWMAALAIAIAGVSQAGAQSGAPEASATTDDTFASLDKRTQLGYGRLFTNDVIGDGQDRWRTGSVTISRAFGYRWDGTAPGALFQLLETRAQGEIIAPENLVNPKPDDRPYAGRLSLGLHTHGNFSGAEVALGADLVFVGPQTHLDSLHKSIHKILGKPQPSDEVLAMQIGNTIRPTLVGEVGHSLDLGARTTLRPFAEARAGDEDILRIGLDMTLGTVGRDELWVRESVTGQQYRVIYRSGPGTSFTIGGDLGYVSKSIYLPESRGYDLVNRRERLRAGFHWQGKKASAFYGITYLGREFEAQPEGQVTGSLRLKLRF